MASIKNNRMNLKKKNLNNATIKKLKKKLRTEKIAKNYFNLNNLQK